jgi:hypothetical protein
MSRNAVRWRAGTAARWRAQIRSPYMPFDAHATGLTTGANTRGLSHSQHTTSAIGRRHHTPTHARLQIATSRGGIVANRV